jgi:uncharacterized protein
MRLFKFISGLVMLLLLIAASGCGRSPDTTLYTLTALAPKSAHSAMVPLSVSVGPISLPDLVDRPEMVIRVSANKVKLLETHLWAEPLRSEIPHLMAENLTRLLRPARVFVYGQTAVPPAQYRVMMDIQRFEFRPEAGVDIGAYWSIQRTSDKSILKTAHSQVHQAVTKAGYDAVVAAYSSALETVCADIARSLSGLKLKQ